MASSADLGFDSAAGACTVRRMEFLRFSISAFVRDRNDCLCGCGEGERSGDSGFGNGS